MRRLPLWEASKGLAGLDLERITSIFVARQRERQASLGLIFDLHDFVLGIRKIGGEREEDIASDALLDGDARAGIAVVAAQGRIQLKL